MWNNFEQSSLEDETISNAFSARGTFKIHSDEEVHSYPQVQASMQNKKMVIAIDKSLVLLEDEMVAKCSFLSFNAPIDVMAISHSGNLIVCGLSDGEIHGIFIKGVPVFNLCVKVEDVHLTGRTFASIQQLDERFQLCCSNGSVYSISEIDESPLKANLNISLKENETTAFDESMLEQPSLKRLSHGGLNAISAAVLIPYYGFFDKTGADAENQNNILLIAGTHNVLYLRSTPEETTRINLPERYGGVKQIFNLENFILVLTNSGHLLEVCSITKMVSFPDSQMPAALLIDKMIVMECSDENIELLVLTKMSATSDEERVMKIIEYPSLKCTSELALSDHAWLVQQPKCSVNLYYISGQNLNSANIPTEVEMMLVSETHPSERFKKLIAKGHLEEAEDFGKQFELCLQPIFEAKARRIFVDLSTLGENNPEQLEQRFNELLALLQIIESKEFFRNNVMKNMPTRNILERFLNEMLKHLNEENDEYHILQVIEQLHRLRTLAIIDPYELNTEWLKFVHQGNLLKLIITLFKTDIPTACLIWKRHSSAMLPQLKEEDLRKCLGLIPNQTEAFNLVQWLRQFVPTVSRTHPNLMPFITEWSIQKTRALQFAQHWPEIGLEFSTKVLEVFEEIEFMHSDVRRQHERNIVKLRDLVNALQDLSVLKKSYNLIVTLDSYLQDSIDETALCILQRVHNLKGLVTNFLYPIFHEQGKSPVAAIRHYITLLANRNSPSTWLERAVACIELLHSEDDRLECALLVLQRSPVPWPETVAPLIKLRYSTHPLALKISTEHEIQVIKIMKVKYGWPADSASDINLSMFMFRIVKMDLPDMLDDVRVLTKAAPEVASSVNFNCCYQLVRRAKPETAYEFFKTLKTVKSPKYAVEVVELFAEMLENSAPLLDDKSIEEQRHLIEFFKLIAPHSTCRSTQQRLRVIQHSFVLRHKFRLAVNAVSDLSALENRLKLLDAGIENIIERSQATVNVLKFITSEVGELSAALQVQKVFGVRRICQRMRCLPLTCALAYTVLEFVDCAPANKDEFVELALELIVQQIEAVKSSQPSSSCAASLFCENDPLAFPLAYELLVSASLQEHRQTRELLELLKYVHIAQSVYELDAVELYYGGKERIVNEQICKALDAAEISLADATLNYSSALNCSSDEKPEKTAPSAALKKRDSVSVFDDVDVQPQQPRKARSNEHMSIVKFVARTLLLMLIESEPINSLLKKLRSLLSEATRNDMDGAHEAFFLSLEQLIKAKVHDVWYIMAQYLLHYQKHNKCKIINADLVSLQLNRVFRNVMSHKDVNFIDLFVMLISDNHTVTLLEKLQNELKTDQQKINLLFLLEKYNSHLKEYTQVETIRTQRIKHYYYMEFCKQDPSIKYKFNADIDNVEQLLKEFHNKQLDVHLLERMSRHFGLDYQQLLITQVISILQAQEPQYEIKTDAFGDEELAMLSTVENMHQLCQCYINEIKNTELLAAKLKHFIKEINIYFYELYLCVIEILSFVDEVPKEMQIWTSILQFLKHKMVTRRHNRPGQLETDMWLQSQADIGVLPKIARYRLPFTPIVEQPLKDILDNELSVDNCESWFPLIQMHTVLKGSTEVYKMRDYFCMAVVKNSIAEYRTNIDTETWHLQPKNNAFLKSIIRLVKHVHSPSKAFMILYFVSNYAPDGADQVESTYECFRYACDNEALITDSKHKEQLAKIKRKYPILKTQHLLHVFGLTDEKLMRLVENPAELIHKLYHHELILKSSKLDINTVVREIAQLHDLDVGAIQFQLLQKWLAFTMEPSTDATVLEETFLEDHNPAERVDEDAGNAAENVVRANYIFSSWPKIKAVQFLVGHIFRSDGSINTSQQLQMYECFSKLNDGNSCFDNKLSQRQYITVKCVHELKQLGYNSSLEKFAGCNKIEILKTIWQRNAQNPHTLEILANICLGYDIYLARIWNGILKRMVMFNMVRELNALVDVLSCQPQLLQTDGLVAAWACVLKHPFTSANNARSFAQEETLHKTLFRLQSCPVVHKLPLFEFADQCCIRLERPHMAAIFLGFCSSDKQREDIKKLISSRKTANMRKEILDLEDAGILSVVLNLALKELGL